MRKPPLAALSAISSVGVPREVSETGPHRVGMLAVLLVAIVSIVLALQGWRSRIPIFDLVTTMDESQQFIDTGRLPDKGVLTSFMSFTPPGVAWLMVPGMAAFEDPRLFEFPGSVVLFIGTLLGIHFLTRRYLGSECAVLAVVLYGLSSLGLHVASSLEFRYPIHCFFVWTIY